MLIAADSLKTLRKQIILYVGILSAINSPRISPPINQEYSITTTRIHPLSLKSSLLNRKGKDKEILAPNTAIPTNNTAKRSQLSESPSRIIKSA
jgi:hypothetical protein